MTTEELALEVERLRGVLARIEALVWYEPEDDDDLVEAVRFMACERNEALSQIRGRHAEFAELHAEVERLRKHFEAASPEHNLPALLDLYDARRTTAEDERDEARAEVERLRAERDEAEGELAWARAALDAAREVRRQVDSLRAERDEARAEIERLRGDLARCREVQKATAEGWRHEVAEVAAIVGAPAHTAELAACVRAEVERLRAALAQAQRADE